MNGLDELYREVILDHYRAPRNRGELERPPAHRAEGFNPLCGDEISVDLLVSDGVVEQVRIGGQGCSISQASASMMTEAIMGRPVIEVRQVVRRFKEMISLHEAGLEAGTSENGAAAERATERAGTGPTGTGPTGTGPTAGELFGAFGDLGELAALQGVVKFPVRIKCATLPWNTLVQGLDEIEAAGS
jgi:nitrogen fixation NifU-like protein